MLNTSKFTKKDFENLTDKIIVPIIPKMSHEELRKNSEKFMKENTITPEEYKKQRKELCDDIKKGIIPGYIDDYGNPHTFR